MILLTRSSVRIFNPSLYTGVIVNCYVMMMMMMFAPNSRTRKEGKKKGEVKGEYGRVSGEEEGNADYEGMVQPNQQHVPPCVKGVKWGLGTKVLRIVTTF